MRRGWRAAVTVVIVGLAVATASATDPGITLIGVGSLPGDALDRFGLAGSAICQRDDVTVRIDRATLGGLGSAVTSTGFDSVFLATPAQEPPLRS